MITVATVLWRTKPIKPRIAPMSLETMTRPRPQRKLHRRRLCFRSVWPLAGVVGLALFAGNMAPKVACASPTDRIVINPDSGLAISGFDPVAYFASGKAVLGRPEFELTENGTVWRFLNIGNRAAFAEHPEVYTPRFGGYDPVAIDRGASVPGHPLIWVVTGERLYLFFDEKSRAAFLANPGRIIESADRKWPAVARTIGR